jgi:hypothetical protein
MLISLDIQSPYSKTVLYIFSTSISLAKLWLSINFAN